MIFKKYKNLFKKISIFFISIFLCGCKDLIIMHPVGIIGIKEKNLIIKAIFLMLIIVVPVIFMTIIFTLKYRSSNKNKLYDPNWCHSNKIESFIWIIPICIIIFLANLTWKSTHDLDPKKSIISSNKFIHIQVISLDWRWLFIYPKQKIATINELVFPVNTPIKFELTSNSVMNSFFIPQLGSQIYTMAGMRSILYLMSNTPGKYKGISSNFSGRGFSDMKFTVKVSKDIYSFKKWIKKVKKYSKYLNNNLEYKKINVPYENSSIEYFYLKENNIFSKIIKKFN